MGKIKDMHGQRFGRLLVLRFSGMLNNSSRSAIWVCLCDCGKETLVPRSSLITGNTRSCGCLHNEVTSKRLSGDNHPMKRPEIKRKVSIANTGKKASIETRKKLSASHKGTHLSMEARKKLSDSISGEKSCKYGKSMKAETKQKISNSLLGKFVGEKNPAWKGGISFEPYCPKFNKNLRTRIRAFFDYRCMICGKPEIENLTKNGKQRLLSCHHVEYDKQACCNNNVVNFAALCQRCHGRMNGNTDRWEQILHRIINEIYDGKSYYTKEEYEHLE